MSERASRGRQRAAAQAAIPTLAELAAAQKNKWEAPLGWCLSGHHAFHKGRTSKPCPGEVLLTRCTCKCHTEGMTKAKFNRLKKPTQTTRRKK